MNKKKDPFGHEIPTINHDFKPPLSGYPGQVVERMPPPKTGVLYPAFVGAFITLVIMGVVFSVLLIHEVRLRSDKQDVIDDLTAQLQTDNDVLQWVFEKQYDREAIELTEVSVSAYSSTRDQTDDTPWQTADGGNVMVGQIAVSRDLINKGVKFGSVVYLEGLGVFRVTDVMGPRWKNKVDIWCADRTACKVFGNRNKVTMIWMKKGDTQ